MAGVLYFYQQKIYDFLEAIENETADSELIDEILDFMQAELFIITPENLTTQETKLKFITSKLNRPIRVCGMVKNEGEAGGGPFWGIGKNNEISLQVVESSQIDLNDNTKKKLLQQSTHFNPVDLICSTKNYAGEKFNLLDYVDPKTGFISNKSLNGKRIKSFRTTRIMEWCNVRLDNPFC